MNSIYKFSPKAYLKTNLLKITLIYLFLVSFFIVVLFVNETLNLISASVVLLVFAAFLYFLVIKMISLRSGCEIKVNECCIEYCFVRFNGISSNLITERYEEDIYHICKIEKCNISSSNIVIYGLIKKEQKRIRNSHEETKYKEVKSVKIPIYFSGKKQFIQAIEEFQEAHNG